MLTSSPSLSSYKLLLSKLDEFEQVLIEHEISESFWNKEINPANTLEFATHLQSVINFQTSLEEHVQQPALTQAYLNMLLEIEKELLSDPNIMKLLPGEDELDRSLRITTLQETSKIIKTAKDKVEYAKRALASTENELSIKLKNIIDESKDDLTVFLEQFRKLFSAFPEKADAVDGRVVRACLEHVMGESEFLADALLAALLHAAETNQENIAVWLIQIISRINKTDLIYVDLNSSESKQEQGVMHFAAKNNSLKIVKAAVAEGMSIDCEDSTATTPLDLAYMKGRQDVANYLGELLQVNLNAKAANGSSDNEEKKTNSSHLYVDFEHEKMEYYYQRHETSAHDADNIGNSCGIVLFNPRFTRAEVYTIILGCFEDEARKEKAEKIRFSISQVIIEELSLSKNARINMTLASKNEVINLTQKLNAAIQKIADELVKNIAKINTLLTENGIVVPPLEKNCNYEGLQNFLKDLFKKYPDLDLEIKLPLIECESELTNLNQEITRLTETRYNIVSTDLHIKKYLLSTYLDFTVSSGVPPMLVMEDLKCFAIALGVNFVGYKETARRLNNKMRMFKVVEHNEPGSKVNHAAVLLANQSHFEKLTLTQKKALDLKLLKELVTAPVKAAPKLELPAAAAVEEKHPAVPEGVSNQLLQKSTGQYPQAMSLWDKLSSQNDIATMLAYFENDNSSRGYFRLAELYRMGINRPFNGVSLRLEVDNKKAMEYFIKAYEAVSGAKNCRIEVEGQAVSLPIASEAITIEQINKLIVEAKSGDGEKLYQLACFYLDELKNFGDDSKRKINAMQKQLKTWATQCLIAASELYHPHAAYRLIKEIMVSGKPLLVDDSVIDQNQRMRFAAIAADRDFAILFDNQKEAMSLRPEKSELPEVIKLSAPSKTLPLALVERSSINKANMGGIHASSITRVGGESILPELHTSYVRNTLAADAVSPLSQSDKKVLARDRFLNRLSLRNNVASEPTIATNSLKQ